MTNPIAAPFDELAACSGLVKTLKTFLADDVGVMVTPDGVETTIPAIYIGGGQVPEATFPRVLVQYQGSSGGHTFQKGWVSVEDPDDAPNTIDVPYYDQYLTYLITVTVQSGAMDEVLESYAQETELATPRQRVSSEKICRKIRNNLQVESVREYLHTNMNSAVRYDNLSISPTFPLDGTQIQNNSVITMTFDTIDREYDLSGGVFDTIVYDGEVFRNEEDPSPIDISGSVGPLSP